MGRQELEEGYCFVYTITIVKQPSFHFKQFLAKIIHSSGITEMCVYISEASKVLSKR